MRSAVLLALVASAIAVPHKREVVTDVDVVYETDVVTVWANASPTQAAEPSSTEVAADESSAPALHYGHNHWGQSSQSASSTPSPSPSTTTTTTSTTPTSTYVPPPPTTTSATSTYVPPPAPTTPTTTSTSTPPPPPPTTTSSSSSSTWVAPTSATAEPAKPTSYEEIVVYHHNLHRNNHSAPDIAWDDDLASIAATIAASCSYGHVTNVSGGGYGQNIAAGVEGTNVSSIITDLFYNGEVNWYDGLYNQDQPDMTNFEHWGHFSQIVWVGTTHVGCATQYCNGPDGLKNVGSGVEPYFTVCNYKDPGNFAGEYGANVLVSKGEPTVGWDAGL